MSYIDIEQHLNEITGDLRQKLNDADAIDTKGNAKSTTKFNQIIDSMIEECDKISRQMEMGRYDPNSANIVQSRIQWLRTIKEMQTLNWDTNINNDKAEKIIKGPDYGSLREVFQDGAKLVIRLFGFQSKHTPQKTVNER